MSAGSHPTDAVTSPTVLVERTRIVSNLFDRVDDMADAGVSAIVAQIPAYAARDESFRADVHDQLARLTRTGLGALLEKRTVTAADLGTTRRAAARRAQTGLTLVEYIKAFRMGQHALWRSLVSYAGESEVGREAALSMVVPLTRYCDFISTQAANAYLEFQEYLTTESGRESRELMESLLDGTMPERGPQLAMAHAHGLGTEQSTAMVVVTGVVLDTANHRIIGDGDSGGSDTDARHLASAALARIGVSGLRTLSVVQRGDIVAIPALGRTGTVDELCHRLRTMREKLRVDGITLGIGVSTVVTDIAQIPRAYQEARAALELLSDDGGVMALPHLTPFHYLLRRADDTARHLVDPRISTLLADDRGRGGAMADTIRAFAAADMNLREAAEGLYIHHNTAKYRLRRIQELTGRNVRHISDLIELLVAIELQEKAQR
ncbi:helix-turn-helix domain-containing protein [Nocardia sp. NPDC050710]|uniref:PucR family transcriptional regulator n=1 Tax=Nocardia sp. NPDC050710 TaxID=3157220 RepID=UPI0033DFBC6E